MVKYLLTGLLLILIPTYINNYGAINFLWFSDITLFLIFFAVWLNSAFLMSIALVLSFFMELLWTIDFFVNMIFNINLLSLASYMFVEKTSLFIRGLSLFHLLLPVLPVYYLRQWGYHKKAFSYALGLYWTVVLYCYVFTPIEENINLVHYPALENWEKISSTTWMLMLLFLYPLLIMLPKNFMFKKLFKPAELQPNPNSQTSANESDGKILI